MSGGSSGSETVLHLKYISVWVYAMFLTFFAALRCRWKDFPLALHSSNHQRSVFICTTGAPSTAVIQASRSPQIPKLLFIPALIGRGVILREWLTSHSSWRLGLRWTEAYEATFYIKIYILGQLSDTFVQSDLQFSIHTLMAVAAMQGVVQHIGSSLGFKDKI